MEEHCGDGLFDLDSTLANYSKAMREKQALLRGPDELVFVDRQGDLPEHIDNRRKLIQSIPGFWRDLEPISLGFDILTMAEDIGFKNSILTKGPQFTNSAWTEKKEWCDKHVPDLDVHISQDKSMVYGKFLVDDWSPYFLAWLKWRPRGKVICVHQEWNKDIDHPDVTIYNGENKEEVYNLLVECAKRDTADRT